MAPAINEKRRTLYWDPRAGVWTETQTPDCKIRVQSLWRSQTDIHVENSLERSFERGGWPTLSASDRATLPAPEQGLVFTVKPRVGEAETYVEVTSILFIDDGLANTFLDGLTLYDVDLQPLASATAASDRFCLTTNHAEIFIQRVRSRGGQINEAQADLHLMYGKLTRLSQIAQELDRLVGMSRQVVDDVADKKPQTEVHTINERSAAAHRLREHATNILNQLRDEKAAADRQVGQIEQQGAAAAYVENAEQWMKRIEQLHREQISYEVQARARTQKAIAQQLTVAEHPASTRINLFIPVVEYYTELGFDCRLTKDGMVIHVGDTTVELGEKPIVSSASGAQTMADPAVGRRTAERTQRDL